MKWKQWGVDYHWLGIILFGLPCETGPSTDRQKGSMASLTFPFSSSQLALGCPFISIDSCSFRCLRGRGRGVAGVGWLCSAFCGYEVAHAGLRSQWGGGMRTHTEQRQWGKHIRRSIHACAQRHVHEWWTDAKFSFFFLQVPAAERGLEWPAGWIMACYVFVCLSTFACVCFCIGDPFCLFVRECFCVSAPPAAPLT